MKLLEPTKLGDIPLKNHMVMAPMTRSRADENGVVGRLTTVYYQQRASAGLIISEGLNISKQATGLPFTPGIYTAEQIEAWKLVNGAVHKAEGKIFAQLWHLGRAAHSHNRNGEIPVGPSAIPISVQTVFTEFGREAFETPRELSTEEVRQVVQDYKQSAINALEAGFDGVELHGAFGYLPNQFLSESSNNRTDEFGGSIENRCRFTLDVMKQLVAVSGPGKAGIKLSPSITYHGILDNDPIALYTYLFAELNKLELAYIHLMQPMFPIDDYPQYPKDVVKAFGDLIDKPLIINAGYTRDTAEEIIKDGKARLVSFGALFLANPDLPKRFELNAPVNEPDRSTMYGGGDEKGYTDYPFLEQV
jgi:N-ethylmaleimide reductase